MRLKDSDYHDYGALHDKVNKALGFDQRECGKILYPNAVTFDEWCDSKGYGIKDPEGIHRNSSQIWFSEFTNEQIAGKVTSVPHCDFWQWQHMKCFTEEVSQNSNMKMYVGSDESKINVNWKPTHDWHWVIQKVWAEVCKDITDDEGFVKIYMDW